MELDRLSACTYPVREDTLDNTFALVSRAGFRKADLWGGPPNYANDPSVCDMAGIKAKAAEYGLRVANLGTYPGLKLLEVGHVSEMREMRWAIENAAFLGARSIRVHAGSGEDPEIIPKLIQFFAEASRYAARYHVHLGVENHKGSISGDPDLIMRLVRAVGSPSFGILFEPANLMQCRVDYREAYRVFRGSIVHVHLKDSRWVGDTYERTMLGEGDVDWGWVTRSLADDGYIGDFALEYEIQDTVPIAEGLPKWLAYAKGI